jgi:hypothetical protein
MGTTTSLKTIVSCILLVDFVEILEKIIFEPICLLTLILPNMKNFVSQNTKSGDEITFRFLSDVSI